MSQLKKCPACDESFKWDDTIVEVNDEFYHSKCVELYPTGYFAMLDDEPLGETENDEGELAFMILDTNEYTEDEE